MRKIIVLLLVALMSCLIFTGCQEKLDEDNIIVIDISDESKQYQKDYIETDGVKMVLSEGIFEQLLDSISNREEQMIPDYEVQNIEGSFNCEDSNVYTLSKENYENVVLYIHGGGWAFEISEEHVQFCDKLVTSLNAKVYMPLYPLTPEANSNETYAMIESLYQEILKEGKNVYVIGDSAGGNIALGLAYAIKANELTAPEKLILIAPCSDMTFSNEEMQKIDETDPELAMYGTSILAKMWAGEDHLKDPKNSALYADVTGYPDTLIFQGTNDILCPDNLLLYQHLKEANVNVTLVKGEGLWHVFPIYPIPEQEKALQIIEEFCFD